MEHCNKSKARICPFYILTILANVMLIIAVAILVVDSYGTEKYIALTILIPPVLSLIALRKGGDKEERTLKKRIRKAQLRKELDDLKGFDSD